MAQTINITDQSKKSWINFLAWLPIPVFIILIFILGVFRFGVVWNPVFLFSALNIIFLAIIMFFVSILAVRSYLAEKSTVILFLGSGTLALGLGALLAGLTILENTVNNTVTIYNTMACISSIFIVGSVISGIKLISIKLKSNWFFILSYISVFLLVIVLAFLVQNHLWPVYFVQGKGPTITDLVVLYVTITLFAISALILLIHNLKEKLNFNIWYGLGLGLIAIGLIGVSVQTSVGDPLNWIGRISQYLGAVYILIALIVSFRETGVWILPSQQNLYETETRYKRIVETANEGIMTSDINGNITFINQEMADMLDYTKEEIIGNPLMSFVDESQDKKNFDTIMNQGTKGNEHFELKFRQKDGSKLWTHASISPIYNYNDQYDGNLGMFADITERKKAEDQKQEMIEKEHYLIEKLNASNEELINKQNEMSKLIKKLEISNKELEQFAYVASHDLQEPLRMVSSFTQLLEMRYKDKLDKDADEYIEFVVEGAHRMKDLIDDLLAFSRLNTDKKEFEFADLNQVLDNVIKGMKLTIEEENAHITHDNLPIISCDSSQIGQVFQNLISNSIKFHQTPPQIHVSVEENDNEWILGVSDEGIGIDPTHHQKIFDVFRRLHTREEYAGTGIGLSICKRIIERHKGRIWVESEPGKGANFYFTIPK